MAAYDDLDDRRIFAVSILSVLVVAVTALAVQVLYYWMVSIQEAETAKKSNYNRQNQALELQEEEIANFGVDPDSGAVTIPIDEAINRVLNQGAEISSDSDEENA